MLDQERDRQDRDAEETLEGAAIAQPLGAAGEHQDEGAEGEHGERAQPPTETEDGERHRADHIRRCDDPRIGRGFGVTLRGEGPVLLDGDDTVGEDGALTGWPERHELAGVDVAVERAQCHERADAHRRAHGRRCHGQEATAGQVPTEDGHGADEHRGTQCPGRHADTGSPRSGVPRRHRPTLALG